MRSFETTTAAHACTAMHACAAMHARAAMHAHAAMHACMRKHGTCGTYRGDPRLDHASAVHVVRHVEVLCRAAQEEGALQGRGDGWALATSGYKPVAALHVKRCKRHFQFKYVHVVTKPVGTLCCWQPPPVAAKPSARHHPLGCSAFAATRPRPPTRCWAEGFSWSRTRCIAPPPPTPTP